MDASQVFVRTQRGQEDVLSKKTDLPSALRVVFFMTDGSASVGQILSQVSALGVTDQAFEHLLALGFIAPLAPEPRAAQTHSSPAIPLAPPPADADRFFVARRFMNETVVNASGLRSFLLTLKLEKANSLADLRLLLPDYARLLEKAGKLEAEVLLRRAREMTAEGLPPKR